MPDLAVHDEGLVVGLALAGGQNALVDLAELVGLFGREYFLVGVAQDLVDRSPRHERAGGVGDQVAPFAVLDEDQVEGLVHQLAQQLFAGLRVSGVCV